MRKTILAAIFATLLPAAAFGQEPDLLIEEDSDSPPGRAGDANIDRAFLTPTAETQPKGSLAVSEYQLFATGVLGASYAITDDLQISGLLGLPFQYDNPLWLASVSAKYRAYSSRRLRLAVQAGATRLADPDEGFDTDSHETWFTGAGIASVCLDAHCSSLVTANLTLPFSDAQEDDLFGSESRVLYTASWVQRLHANAKLLLEVSGMASSDAETGWTVGQHWLVNYGLRLNSKSWTGEVGFMRPLDSDGNNGGFPPGLPFLQLTYRTM